MSSGITPVNLVVEDVSVLRGERLIVADVSFVLAPGGALLLKGPNGAGKTTLLRAIAGFLQPERGTIRLDGGVEGTPLWEQCHYIGHLNAVKSGFTAFENLMFWAGYLGGGTHAAREIRALAALDRLGLGALGAVAAGYLSAGQKRRLALARLLAAHRPLWLLDEPTTSLDATSAELVRDLIAEHVANGGLAIAATHQPLDLPGTAILRLGGTAPQPATPTKDISAGFPLVGVPWAGASSE